MLDAGAFDATIGERLASDGVPGAAVAIVHGTEVIFARGYGLTSADEDGHPITPLTLFQIGSTTKPLTGSMIMRLVDAGLLDLDRPIMEWLPELRFGDPGAAEVVTLRMLLSHTAGLPRDQITPHRMHGSRDPDALGVWVRVELPERLLVGSPGGQWLYSNPGINLAARVAEVASGHSYADLMRSELFEPLAMTRTTFDPTVAMTWPIAQAHTRAPDGTPVVVHRAADNAAQYPAAFAWSDVVELANFALMNLNTGKFRNDQVMSEESIASMQAPHARRGTDPDASYGLTFEIDRWRGLLRVRHPGGINGFTSEFDLLPALEIGAVALCNQGETTALREIVEDVLSLLISVGCSSLIGQG